VTRAPVRLPASLQQGL